MKHILAVQDRTPQGWNWPVYYYIVEDPDQVQGDDPQLKGRQWEILDYGDNAPIPSLPVFQPTRLGCEDHATAREDSCLLCGEVE